MSAYTKTSQVHGVGVAALVLCMLVAYFCGLRPALQAQVCWNETAKDREHLERMHPTLQREVELLKTKIGESSRRLEETRWVVTQKDQPLLQIINLVVLNHQIELVNLLEEPAQSDGSEMVALQISGEFRDVILLIDELERLDRPSRILALSLQPAGGSRCAGKLSIKVYPRIDRPQSNLIL